VPGQPTDDRTGWLAMAGGAMLIAAVGKRRRR
jgi:MYXO-CTERM domain-containing protein